jgi:hypothetical protein
MSVINSHAATPAPSEAPAHAISRVSSPAPARLSPIEDPAASLDFDARSHHQISPDMSADTPDDLDDIIMDNDLATPDSATRLTAEQKGKGSTNRKRRCPQDSVKLPAQKRTKSNNSPATPVDQADVLVEVRDLLNAWKGPRSDKSVSVAKVDAVLAQVLEDFSNETNLEVKAMLGLYIDVLKKSLSI